MRDFTVPRGSPRRSAISLWLRPLKYASSSTSRCGGEQVGQRAAHALPLLARDERGRHVVLAGARRDVVDVSPALRAGLLAPHEVDGAAVHEREQVARGPRARRIEARRTAPEIDEGLLHDVLGLARIAHDAQRQRVGGPAEEVVQLGERAFIPVRAARDEQDVGRRGLHRRERTRAYPPVRDRQRRREGHEAHCQHSSALSPRFASRS